MHGFIHFNGKVINKDTITSSLGIFTVFSYSMTRSFTPHCTSKATLDDTLDATAMERSSLIVYVAIFLVTSPLDLTCFIIWFVGLQQWGPLYPWTPLKYPQHVGYDIGLILWWASCFPSHVKKLQVFTDNGWSSSCYKGESVVIPRMVDLR
jgi:hypothetical protein